MSFEEFINLGISDVNRKLSSIPKNEPLYLKIKARAINVGKIKDKGERKYWQELKHTNQIPRVFLSQKEQESDLIAIISKSKILGGK